VRENPASHCCCLQHTSQHYTAYRYLILTSPGCITCKNKRLKCDETKPTCRQCAKRSVTCGGYKKDFKWRPFEEPNVPGKQAAKARRGTSLLPILRATVDTGQTLTSRPRLQRPPPTTVRPPSTMPMHTTPSPARPSTSFTPRRLHSTPRCMGSLSRHPSPRLRTHPQRTCMPCHCHRRI
jgi:hypothetical protein